MTAKSSKPTPSSGLLLPTLIQAPYFDATIWCMRTTLDIDDKLLQEVALLSGQRTRSSAVEAALREYVRLLRKEQLLSMSGRVRIEENWRDLRQAELDERAGSG